MLKRSPARTELPRQITNYTCGIASLAAAAELLGRPIRQKEILRDVPTAPKIGTDHDDMARWAAARLPVKDYGCDTYRGGLAIANIQNRESGIGHYVVLLGERDGVLRYFCPLVGLVVTTPREDMVWLNSDGSLANWSVNFECDRDFYDIDATPRGLVFVLGAGDDAGRLSPLADGVLARYHAEDRNAVMNTLDQVMLRDDRLYLNGVPVLENDRVVVACSRDEAEEHADTLALLSYAQGDIVNLPQARMAAHEGRREAARMNGRDLFAIASDVMLDRCWRYLQTAGFKVSLMRPYSGRDMRLTRERGEFDAAYRDLSEGSGVVHIEGMPEEASERNRVRLAITRDALYGIVPAAPMLSVEQKRTVKALQNRLDELDAPWAVLDFVGDTLVDFDRSFPGEGMAARDGGDAFARDVVAAIDRLRGEDKDEEEEQVIA